MATRLWSEQDSSTPDLETVENTVVQQAPWPHLLYLLYQSQPTSMSSAHGVPNSKEKGGTRVCLRSAAKNDSKDVIQYISEVKVHLNIQKQWWLFVSTVIMQITAVGGTEQNVFSKCFK